MRMDVSYQYEEVPKAEVEMGYYSGGGVEVKPEAEPVMASTWGTCWRRWRGDIADNERATLLPSSK